MNEHKSKIVIVVSIGLYLLLYVVPVLGSIILMHVKPKFGTPGDWLGFFGGYLGSIAAIIGVYWQVNKTERYEKKRNIEKTNPVFFLRYNRAMKENELVYYNLIPNQWSDFHNKETLDFELLTMDRLEMIPFTTQCRYTPRIPTITNVSNHDAYFCSIKLTYYWGAELDKMFLDHLHFSDLDKTKLELHHEHIEVPVIKAKEQIAVIIWPTAWHRFAKIKTLSMTYKTESGVFNNADFSMVDLGKDSELPQVPKIKLVSEPLHSYFKDKQSVTANGTVVAESDEKFVGVYTLTADGKTTKWLDKGKNVVNETKKQ